MPLISIIIRNKSIWRFQNVKNYLLIHNYYLLFSLVSCKRKQNQFKSWKSLWSGYREIVRCGHTPKWLKNHFPRWNWPKLPRIWPKFPEKVKFMNFDWFWTISGWKIDNFCFCRTFIGHFSFKMIDGIR